MLNREYVYPKIVSMKNKQQQQQQNCNVMATIHLSRDEQFIFTEYDICVKESTGTTAYVLVFQCDKFSFCILFRTYWCITMVMNRDDRMVV